MSEETSQQAQPSQYSTESNTPPDPTPDPPPEPIATGGVHHCTLTVSDVERSAGFYTRILGFRRGMELGPAVLLGNGSVILTLTPSTATSTPATFKNPENSPLVSPPGVGLDYLSFTLANRDELEAAAQTLEAHHIAHEGIRDLGPDLGLYVLALRDPDNIRLELRAPYDLET